MKSWKILVTRASFGQIILNAESEAHAVKRVTDGIFCDVSGPALETDWEIIGIEEQDDDDQEVA